MTQALYAHMNNKTIKKKCWAIGKCPFRFNMQKFVPTQPLHSAHIFLKSVTLLLFSKDLYFSKAICEDFYEQFDWIMYPTLP
jgi:hypothetical protein